LGMVWNAEEIIDAVERQRPSDFARDRLGSPFRDAVVPDTPDVLEYRGLQPERIEDLRIVQGPPGGPARQDLAGRQPIQGEWIEREPDEGLAVALPGAPDVVHEPMPGKEDRGGRGMKRPHDTVHQDMPAVVETPQARSRQTDPAVGQFLRGCVLAEGRKVQMR